MSGMPKRMKWLIYAILWIVLLAFPFFISGRNTGSVGWFGYLRFLTMLSGIAIVFYVNYLYLVKRFLFSRQIWQYIVVNLLLFTALTIITHFIMGIIMQEENMRPPHHSEEGFFIRFVLFDYVKFLFIAALSVALKMTNSWYKAEAERKDLEKTRSEAELQNLKSQLNPHFLFNTLNNIYSLIAINQDRAQEAIHELSRLLRYMLYDSSYQFVTLEKDLDFVCNYIELMRIRLPEHAELRTDIQRQSPDIRIAPLLFISIIENAFKHGVSNNKPCFIDIRIVAEQKQIRCSIRNSYFPKDEQDKSGSGIGIVNLQKRLELLYPDTHEFVCEHNGDVFRSELLITLS